MYFLLPIYFAGASFYAFRLNLILRGRKYDNASAKSKAVTLLVYSSFWFLEFPHYVAYQIKRIIKWLS